MHDLAAVPAIDAEIFALWLADLALAQKLGWKAPVPLLATVIAHPALRRAANGRRPRPTRSRLVERAGERLRACGG